MEPSSFQKAIYEVVSSEDCNIMINAVAGSGKTTTLIGCLDEISEFKSAAFIAFNNSIVDELKSRIKRPNTQVTTMHSLCWRALLKQNNYKCKLKPNKSIKYIEKVCRKNDIPKKRINWYMYTFSKLLDLIRQNLCFETDDIIKLGERHSMLISKEDAVMLREILEMMNKNSKEFDFTDMIYRAILDEIKFPKYDFIFIDESQDLSRLQQMVISRIKSRRGRMIAVGDPNQAIYGFAGADVESYEMLKNLFPNTKELPLSVNYRCGSRIIKEAKKINPKIIAFDGNGKGEVKSGFIDDIKEDDWVLCRNVKPLVLTNLYLLSKGIKAYVRGSDIGLGLIAIINKTGSANTKSMLARYKTTIKQERLKMVKRGVKNPDNSEKMEMMRQKLEILFVLSDGIFLTKELKKKIKSIFKDQGKGVCLSTIHKSKGLENDTIHFLCPELIPSRFAEQPWEFKQEKNLEYVAITRAKSKLVYVQDYQTVVDSNKDILKNLEK
jgi:superfamily I DNA/RNA helicase